MHIALAGCDGAGKSGHVDAIVSQLTSHGLSVTATREPGGTELGSKIRELFLHGEAMSAKTEALLMYADRLHHIERVVGPALEEFQVVVSDRSLFCTAAFQLAGGLPVSHLEALEQMVSPEFWPSHVLLFDVQTEVALSRIAKDRGLDRIESKDADYHVSVRENYLMLARKYPEIFTIIDAGRTFDRVGEQVASEVDRIIHSTHGKAWKIAAGA